MIQAIGSHLLSLVFLSGLYLGWAAIGQLLTGWYPFFWLDKEQVGSEEAVTAYCIGFVILAPLSKSLPSSEIAPTNTFRIVYVLMQGFVGTREAITRSLAEARAKAIAAAAQDAIDEEDN